MDAQLTSDKDQIQEPPDIRPADATFVAPLIVPAPVQQPPTQSPYYEQDEGDEQESGEMSSPFAAPFQVSSGMPVVEMEQSWTGSGHAVPSQSTKDRPSQTKRHRVSLLRWGVTIVGALLALGVLWLTVFAQPAQQLATPSSPSTHQTQSISTPVVKVGTPIGTAPTPMPTVPTGSAAGGGQNGTWVPQQLPAGWTNAGLTTADGIFAERTAVAFTDREEGLDFRTVGTRAQHGGTFTASTFILSPGGKSRFTQNDVRVVDNTFFDKVAATQLIQSEVNATPNLVNFQVQGQNQFAWVDVSYVLFTSQIDPNNAQHRIAGVELDPATNQPRTHHMSVLLVRVAPQTQKQGAPMGGTGWLVSSYGLDLTTPLVISQPI